MRSYETEYEYPPRRLQTELLRERMWGDGERQGAGDDDRQKQGGGEKHLLLPLTPPSRQHKEHFWQPTNQPPEVICHGGSVGSGSGVWRNKDGKGKGER